MSRLNLPRRALPLALALAMSIPLPGSHAVVVTCTNCGTEFTQLANNLQLADQLAKQVELVQQSIRQSENLLLNTKGLGQFEFGNALAELRQVTTLLGQAKSLSFTSAQLDGQFVQKYKDYNAYVQGLTGIDALDQKYQQWSEDTNSSVLTTLKAAKLHSGQIEGGEDALFQELEGMAGTAEGRMQALQVANQIALAAARQTQKLRQILLMQVQLQAMYIQTQMDKQAAEGGAWRTFTKQQDVNTGNGKRY